MPDELDDARKTGSDVIEAAAEQPHVVTMLVGLHSNSIELPLDAGQADLGNGIGDTRRRAGEHRLHRRQRSEADVERLTGQCSHCCSTQVAQQHRCSTHRSNRRAAGLGDTVGHNPFVGPLAELARQDADTGDPARPRSPPTTASSWHVDDRPASRFPPSRRAGSMSRRRREWSVTIQPPARPAGSRSWPSRRRASPGAAHRSTIRSRPRSRPLASPRSKLGQRGHLLRALRCRGGSLRRVNEVAVQHGYTVTGRS